MDDIPTKQFGVVTYTGNGTARQVITGTWISTRFEYG
jgi:hypothetical protein